MAELDGGGLMFVQTPAGINWRYVFILALIPVLASAVSLSGFFNCDPEAIYSGLGHISNYGLVPGAACYVDPTVAYITQPLGYLSAKDWLHGMVPWWNPFSGVGMPLAAEMQTESLFLPFVFLLHFHSGWLIQRLLFQSLSGVFTYIFLIEFGVVELAALLGGALFSLNATFFLTPHATIAPIFFLPLFFLGIEIAYRTALKAHPMGWSLITFSLAGSIYAGYPETAFFDGLLCAVWVIYRACALTPRARISFATKIIVSGVIGVILAAPIILPFFQYLSIAQLGSHGDFYAHDHLYAAAAPLQIFPFFYGGVAVSTPSILKPGFHDMWVTIGGWYGSTAILFAVFAVIPKGVSQSGRYVLFGWVLFWQARYFNVPGAIFIANLIPGVASADAIRFSMLSTEYALFCLTACGFSDLLRQMMITRWQGVIWLSAFLLLVIIATLPALQFYPTWFHVYPKLRYSAAGYCLILVAVNLFLAVSVLMRRYILLAGFFVFLESSVAFLIPQLSAPRTTSIDTSELSVFNRNPGLSRLYVIGGGFSPNYSAQYGLNEINFNALPVPKLWTDYLESNLFPGADEITFGGGQPGQADDFVRRAINFEAIGVNYLITSPGQAVFSGHNSNLAALLVNSYAPISHDRSVGDILPSAILHPASISSVSVVVGTYYGKSTLPIYVKLCDVSGCAEGSESLAKAGDNQPLVIALAQPLKLIAGESLSVQFFHPAGQQVAVWLPTGLSRSDYALEPLPDGSSRLVMNKVDNLPSVPRIFHDNTMDIYQLPNPAPYAQSNDDACHVVIYSRQKMDSDCPHPTTLVRRELYYPGWRAQVNGVDIPITQTEDIFQRINLPAGPAKIRFTYMPPYTPLACAAAIAAALFWLAAGILSRRRHAKN